MSTYNAMPLSAQTVAFCAFRYFPVASSIPSMNPSVTTYYYRTTGGTRGSTTSPASIPVGAVVELVVTA